MAKQILQEAGLSEAEIGVYRCLLQNGPLKVSEISKRVGMYRPYVYDNLYKLIGKGLCSNIIIDGKKVFKAASPETLHDYMDEKMRAIDEIIPELEKEMLKGHDETQVWVFRGKNAVRKALMDVLKELKAHSGIDHLGIGIDEMVFMKSEPLFSRWFIRQLEKNRIKERLITYESEKIFIGGPGAEYRMIPDEYFNPAQTLIDGNLVTFLLMQSEPKYAIKIRNSQLADAYRKQFELLWKMGKTREQKQMSGPRKKKKP